MHTLSDEHVGATVWKLVDEHGDTSVHVVARCRAADWNVPVLHAGHVRTAVIEAVNRVHLPHTGCSLHAVVRCPVWSWYDPAPQLEHDRAAVLVSALIFWPLALHVGCAMHAVLRWFAVAMNVFEPHATQVPSLELDAPLMYWPGWHTGCAMQFVL